MRNRALIAAVAILGIALAGCGSSNSTSSSSASASSSAAPTTASSSAAATTTSSASAGGGAAAFKAAFLADRTQFRQLGNNLAKSLTGASGKTDDELATEFQGLATKAKDQASKLSQLTPPARLKPTVDKLVTSLNNVGDKLQKIATDAKNHNASSAKADTIKLVQESVQVKAADTTLSNDLKLPSSS